MEVRLMGALTGPPTPWRLPSPAWMAWVWAPSWRGVDFALADFLDEAVFIVSPFCAAAGDAAKRQIGECATERESHKREALAGTKFEASGIRNITVRTHCRRFPWWLVYSRLDSGLGRR